MTRKLRNPFVYKGYEGPEYFCDRTEETEKIVSGMQNGRNITLISPRRVGKTGLIKHVFHHLQQTDKSAVCLYIDIFATQRLHDFVTLFCSAFVEEVVNREKSIFSKALEAFKGWRPVFGADPLTGVPQVSVTIEPVHTEHTLRSIFDYIERLDKEVYIAFDEFQQITQYPEQGTEALLRSYIQFSHAHFIFSGSKFHLMSEMFSSPKRPFYLSTQFLYLAPLHEEIYYLFANHFFEHRKGLLTREAFHHVYGLCNGSTWHVQLLLNRLYETERRVETEKQVNVAVESVLSAMAPGFEGLLLMLTPNQQDLLKAIARAEPVGQPQGKDFIKRYDLSSPSSVKSSVTALQDKDLIFRDSSGYIVYDRLMSLWLRRQFGTF